MKEVSEWEFKPKIKLGNREFREYISKETINLIVQRVAVEMNKDLEGKNPLFIFVLNGVFIFAADLIREITTPCELSFIKVSSYEGIESTNDIKTQIGLKEDVKDRTVVIVEDIIDTGNTIHSLLEVLSKEQPKEIKIATLLFKPTAFKREFKIDYVGREIERGFVVGYGLDYDGVGRNLKAIYKAI